MRNYNLDFIRKMTRGNEQLIAQSVSAFIEQTPELLKKMQEAWEQQNFSELRESSHKLKPTLSYYGIPNVDEAIRRIEEYAEQQEWPAELPGMIDQVIRHTNLAIHDLRMDFLIVN